MKEQRFQNADPSEREMRSLLEVLKWKLFNRAPKWPKWVDDRVQPNLPSEVEEGEVFVTFINHSTALIQFKGLTVLTDPVFSKSVGPAWGPKIKRIRPPGLTTDELPPIDLVVISHNHFDHLDLPSIKKIQKLHHPFFIVPLGIGPLLQSIGIKKVRELNWWEEAEGVTLTPAQHWSGRGLRDRRSSLWAGALFRRGDVKVFFAGDTGYNGHFGEIRDRFGEIDVALLPIGAYEPRWFMKSNHMNPEDAVKAHIDLGSKLSIAIHFETFHLSDERFGEAEKKLKESLAFHRLTEEEFIAPRHGETFRYMRGKRPVV